MTRSSTDPATRIGTTHASSAPDDRSSPANRFAPGVVIAGRFRVIALLGQGGMAEVYRAEDLRLGQQVALKFLPSRAASDPAMLARLHKEVRLGRQISHPNLCRLYDLFDWDGHHFIAMEYIDGEDLESLLRRIGTLPADKARDVAGDLAAGLAALHEAGVVHRDLKPANVMIDGRGRARITDFGIADLAGDLAHAQERSGTPAYMAPEQLGRGEATERSDLYALGLVLYEVCTGRRRFSAPSYQELHEQHARVTADSLGEEVRQVDPLLRRVIVACLQEEPERRPASCRAVIAWLPNRDALQAAMDAGDTPSPEVVAAAGGRGDLQPAHAVGAFVALIALLGVAALTAPAVSYYGFAEATRTPSGLRDRAREVLEAVGPFPARDAAVLTRHHEGFAAVARAGRSPDRWAILRDLTPGPVEFVYRQSPDLLVPSTIDGRVTPDNPPPTQPGMVEIRLDTAGRLVRFSAVPGPGDASTDDIDATWRQLFAFAGLDFDRRTPATRPAVSTTPGLAVESWRATRVDRPSIEVRVDATAAGGRPVQFTVTDSRVPDGVPPPVRALGGTSENPMPPAALVLRVVMLVVAVVLASRNVRQRRGDLKGALRTAATVAVLLAAGRVIGLDHVPGLAAELNLIVYTALPIAIAEGAMVWLTYVAVEPYVRRFWPHALISWNRVVTGHWRDPRVGRDLLVGLIGGLIILSADHVSVGGPALLGEPALSPLPGSPASLAGLAAFAAAVLNRTADALRIGVSVLSFLFLFLVATRSRHVAVVALMVFVTLGVTSRGEYLPVALATGLVSAATAVVLLTRFGLLSGAASILTVMVLQVVPLTLDASAWYFGRSLFGILLITGLGIWGFRQSLGGRTVFRPLLEKG